jgi:hypothetical protein
MAKLFAYRLLGMGLDANAPPDGTEDLPTIRANYVEGREIPAWFSGG